MKSVAVIGSGVGGLAIALRLAVRGFQVEIFERAETPGGKLNEFSVDGFRFDTGPSLFTLPELVEELIVLCGRKPEDYLQMKQLEMTCRYYFPDGSVLPAWAEKDRFLETLKEQNYSSEEVEQFLKHQEFIFNNTQDFFLFTAIHKLSVSLPKAFRQNWMALLKLDPFTSMHARNRKSFHHPNLTQLFDRYATYNGSNPYQAPATLNMIAHLEHNKGAFFPVGGMYEIVRTLVKLAEEMNIGIHTQTAVKKLVTEKNQVSGIETEQGFQAFDYVVNDTDISYFYSNLLPDSKKLERIKKRGKSSSALIFYWGMNIQSTLDVHTILFSKDYQDEFDGLFGRKVFANDLTVYIFISSKANPSDAPEGKENWFVMVNAPEEAGQDWQAEIGRARSIILKKIQETLHVDISAAIESEKILTPQGIAEKTASVGGSLYGNHSNSPFSAFLRHPNFSRKYKNLFFVGGSVHPGGGIPLCLASAKIVDELISQEVSSK